MNDEGGRDAVVSRESKGGAGKEEEYKGEEEVFKGEHIKGVMEAGIAACSPLPRYRGHRKRQFCISRFSGPLPTLKSG